MKFSFFKFLNPEYRKCEREEEIINAIYERLIFHQPELSKLRKRIYPIFRISKYRPNTFDLVYKDRSCNLVSFDKEYTGTFIFKWEEANLFHVNQNDLKLLAEVIKKWLVDEIMPSNLAQNYDWIDIGDVALYYEKGEGLKGEFLKSWDNVESFYQTISFSFCDKVLLLIKEIRQREFDVEIRAGQSLWNLVLSRSKMHGLRPEQKRLIFRFDSKKDEMIVYSPNLHNEVLKTEIGYSKELKAILDRLCLEKIE